MTQKKSRPLKIRRGLLFWEVGIAFQDEEESSSRGRITTSVPGYREKYPTDKNRCTEHTLVCWTFQSEHPESVGLVLEGRILRRGGLLFLAWVVGAKGFILARLTRRELQKSRWEQIKAWTGNREGRVWFDRCWFPGESESIQQMLQDCVVSAVCPLTFGSLYSHTMRLWICMSLSRLMRNRLMSLQRITQLKNWIIGLTFIRCLETNEL